MNKQTLRKEMIQLRNSLLPPYRVQASREISNQIQALPVYQEAEFILAYFSFRNEVSLYPLIEDAWRKGKQVALPRMEQDRIVPVRFTSPSELVEDAFTILEPDSTCKPVDPKEIDLVLVPGVAFDRQGYRLGYGKGHYDRFFATLSSMYKLGIAYQEQIVDTIYPEPHDISMDYIVHS
jgi:5-formyltetrahydrofolate cyclo-ligase